MIPSRTLLLVSTLLVSSLAHSADTKKSAKKVAPKKEKTWSMLVEHVLKKGGEWPIKAPASRTLGYDSDSVPTKSLGIDQEKSKDNWEHSVFVVYEKDDKGIPRAKEIILANLRVTEADGKERIDGFDARATLDGKLIGGMRAVGEVGKVVQTALKADSAELRNFFNSERDMFLKKLDWTELSTE